MTHDFERTHLWKSSLAKRSEADEHEIARDLLRNAYLKFRDRVSHLVSGIKSELPGLTVHGITHLDALWRVASEIAGPTFELTPAEAFVLGGAILLHDSAHAIAAFPGGKAEIKQTQHWRDLIAQRYSRQEPTVGSDDERAALFQVLRHLHATQAAKLPFVKWTVPGDDTPNFLIEDAELRNYYGELIGQIAESHHWSTHRVATEFSHQNHTPPSYLPTEWTVDAMKVAFLLRTADAAHIDDARAPWFLFALQKPEGISAQHWHFQLKLGQAKCNEHGELQISSASSFGANESEAWWLAYETVQMIDRELRDAHGLMRDHWREVFRAISVLGASSSESFARYVKPRDWEPIDVAPKIGNVNKIIDMLGGQKLYGDRPDFALRELLQNAIDAIHAKRALGGLTDDEGEITVALDKISDNNYRLSVADNGIGMSRYVITNFLLDFGSSLWTNDAVRSALPGLAVTRFEPAGQFGIGFFSVFMLGEHVEVESWPHVPQRAASDSSGNVLSFRSGSLARPSLTNVNATKRHGSGTNIRIDTSLVVAARIIIDATGFAVETAVRSPRGDTAERSEAEHLTAQITVQRLAEAVSSLVPTGDVSIFSVVNGHRLQAVNPSDWLDISEAKLLSRTSRISRELTDPIEPIFSETGVCVGRLGLFTVDGKWYSGHCLACTHKGVVVERNYDFIGTLQAAGPMNAARTSAIPIVCDIASWRDWARRLIRRRVTVRTSSAVLALLGQLLPDDDLPVYEFRGANMSCADVIAALGSSKKLTLHAGEISFDEDVDDMTRPRFDNGFRLASHVVILPSQPSVPALWKHLDLEKVDYESRIREALREAWGDFEECSFRDDVVGEVDGLEIVRDTVEFARDPSE